MRVVGAGFWGVAESGGLDAAGVVGVADVVDVARGVLSDAVAGAAAVDSAEGVAAAMATVSKARAVR
jgi:hypothetical protein